jgi:hypothetical protein
MPVHRRGLFRRKLAVQIFPEAFRDLGTIHSRPSLPRGEALPGFRYALVNSALRQEVPPG